MAAMVALLAAMPFGVPHAGAQGTAPAFDHLKCYKIKDFNPVKVVYTLDLTPEQTQFLKETGCAIKNRAKWFCIDVQKTNVKPPPPLPIGGADARDYLCYVLKCPETVEVPLVVQDQFGLRDIVVKKKPDHLCVPAEKQGEPTQPTPTVTPPPPTRTATPTPTATRTPVPCQLGADGVCNGDCPAPFPPGSKCLFEPAINDCRCVDGGAMCMPSAAAGVCSGLCPGVADECVPLAGTTDCDCQPPCGPTGPHMCGGTCPPGETCVVQPDDTCRCQATTVPCDVGSLGPTCAGDCSFVDPTYKCLFSFGVCECLPPDQMCMDDGSGVCGGACPNAPGLPQSQCQPTGPPPSGCDCLP